MGVEPRRVRRRRAPVARLDAPGEEHSVAPRLASAAAVLGAPPSSWRRPAGPRSPRIQRGRSRRILPICPRRPRTEMPLRRAVGDGRRCPPAPSGAVGEAPLPSGLAALRVCVFEWAGSFGCEGNARRTHHCSAKGPVVHLNATTKTAQGPGHRESPRESPRAATPQHRKTSARAQPSRRGAPRRAAERRTGLVIRNLGAGWDYKLPAVLCYIPLGKPAAGRRYYHPARQPRQLKTREAAAHGTMPSRRTPPQARGGFAAPAGQLNARAWGSPQKIAPGE